MVLVHKVPFHGKVEKLYSKSSRKSGFEKPERESLNLLFSGPEDDCHAGMTREADSRTLLLYKRGTQIRNVRQVTIVAPDELAEVAARMGLPAIDPVWLGANMLMSGIPDLTLLPPSTRIQFSSGATIVVDMENAPCTQVSKVIVQHHGEIGYDFVKHATHKRGVTAWVEREGEVNVGDMASLFLPPARLYAHG